ncbi:MAG: GntR family transcriptional regulator [Verrucomicrobiota bacterium]
MTLKEQAYAKLLDRILSGDLSPGTILNRRGTAKDLGMSTAPVHEAMLQLEQDGFVQAIPRMGTRVCGATSEDVRGHLVLREAFECQAARMLDDSRLKSELPRLQSYARTADDSSKSVGDRLKAEVDFHTALVELTDCQALLHEYRRVMRLGLFYRINQLMDMPTNAPEKRHEALLDALLCQSAADRENCMREHVWSGKPDALKRQP